MLRFKVDTAYGFSAKSGLSPNLRNRPIADIATEATCAQFAGMRRIRPFAAIAALLLFSPDAQGGQSTPRPHVGQQHEIVRSYETSEQGGDGSTGSSRGRDAIIERVIAVREAGIELEYDLPQNATQEDRARQWHLPARILRQSSGEMQLLNRSELEARLERWLRAAEWTREICGRWIFTWNAFRIDCDPESVLDVVRAVDLRSDDLREGASYQDSEARGPGILRQVSAGADGVRFTVVMDVDPEAIRRARSEADVAVGEIMRQPITLEAALLERARERISGTIEITLEVDPSGNVQRRTKMTRLEIVGQSGRETQTRTEIVERRPVLVSESPQ